MVNPSTLLVDSLPFWKKKRNLVLLLTFFGYVNMYTLRVNLSVAIVAMTGAQNASKFEVVEPTWDSTEKGLVLSSFFYGYVCTQLIGGYIANKYGGHLMFGIGVASTAFLTLLSPLAAKAGLYVFVALRIVMGVFEGSAFPSMHAITANWSPPLEVRTSLLISSLHFKHNFNIFVAI